ncbi:Uncharacterised protein [Vibrio cholerae]|nr:Uncharacterised protein [Vibrio cholerae]
MAQLGVFLMLQPIFVGASHWAEQIDPEIEILRHRLRRGETALSALVITVLIAF